MGTEILVDRFTVPGHSTRREFAVYVVIARKRGTREFWAYVGKTGDNRDGCNPVISRAGNHFSYNTVHSQVRNKLGADLPLFDYEFFYVTFDTYDETDINRKNKVDVVNEMERVTNQALKRRLSPASAARLLNEFKGAGYVPLTKRKAREVLRTPERLRKVQALVDVVIHFIASFHPEATDQLSTYRPSDTDSPDNARLMPE